MITINKVLGAKEAYTHGGVFHADDIFSAALLRYINRDIHIIRTFNPPTDDEAIVFDIGGGEYDHHGVRDFRPNHDDVPYAAFGKLWRDLGPALLGSKKLADNIDKSLIWDIDTTDNFGQGRHPNLLSFSMSSFNPEWNSTEDPDVLFDRAVGFALQILSNCIQKELSKEEAREVVLNSDMSEGILVMDQFAPWKGVVNELNMEKAITKCEERTLEDGTHESIYDIDHSYSVKFAIYPSQRGGYNLETVPALENLVMSKDTIKTSREPNEFLVPLMCTDWAVVDFEGCKFCHPSGFLSSFETKEDALKAARSIITLWDNVKKVYDFKVTRPA